VTCSTARRFWRWHGFPLRKLVPRELQVPEEDADLNEWRAQAVAAALCASFALAAFLLQNSSSSVPLSVLAYLAGSWFAAKEAWVGLRRWSLDVHFLMLTVAAGSACVGAWSEGAMLLFLFSTSGALER
jgi:Zn2+/Cd2+-exporting ATPase